MKLCIHLSFLFDILTIVTDTKDDTYPLHPYPVVPLTPMIGPLQFRAYTLELNILPYSPLICIYPLRTLLNIKYIYINNIGYLQTSYILNILMTYNNGLVMESVNV